MSRQIFNKNIVLSFVALIFLALWCTPFPVQAQTEPIKIGYVPQFQNFMENPDSLNAKGYGYEIFEKIAEISDLKFEYVPMTEDVHVALQNGSIDFAGFYIRTPDRQQSFLYSETQFGKTYVSLTTDDPTIPYNDPKSLDGKTVATYYGNLSNQYLDNYCAQNGISVQYVFGNIYDYTEKEADFFITYSSHTASEGKYNVLNLGVFNLYLVSSFENQALMDQINKIFLQVIATEGNYFMELEEKYLADDIAMNHRTLSAKEIAKLQSRTWQVGYIATKQPTSFQNGEGKPEGAMIDVMEHLSNKFGFEVEYHPYTLSEDPTLHQDFDLIITLYGDSEEELQFYDPTDPYYMLQMFGQISSKTYQDYDTREQRIENSPRIGTLQYMMIDYDALLEQYPDNPILFYKDFDSLLNDYSKGFLDLIISTESGTAYAETYLQDVDRTTIPLALEVPMQFFVSKSLSDEFLSIFNVMLDTVDESDYRTMLVNNANNYLPETTWTQFLKIAWPYLLIAALAIFVGFVGYALIQQRRKRREITKAYNVDALTALLSAPRFGELMEEYLRTATKNSYEVISLDIDMFKNINTYYSIGRGSAAIRAVGNGLKEALQETSALIMRRTADQFVIMRKISEGPSVRELYRDYIYPKLQDVLGDNYHISMSFGIYTICNCQEKISNIIDYADDARMRGKHSHQTSFVTFDETMKKEHEDKLNITFRMEQALKDREFTLVYQPKINFQTLRVDGAEALVRWNSSQNGVIYPDQFIPIFEENGFILPLDLYVFEEVCRFIAKHRSVFVLPRISVNLSAWSVMDKRIVISIHDLMQQYDIKSTEIELEITESAITGDEKTFLQKVKQLKTLGCAISIDDFGAGVSSLNRLSAIEADVLKLDKAFFDLKDQGGKSTVVVEDVITMAKHLNMAIVAEGVETFGQALWLRELQCEYAQGYYFERPMDEESFKKLLESKKTYQLKP